MLQYVVGSFACIGGGLFGLDISSMSGVLNVSAHPQHLCIAYLILGQNESYLREFHSVRPCFEEKGGKAKKLT